MIGLRTRLTFSFAALALVPIAAAALVSREVLSSRYHQEQRTLADNVRRAAHRQVERFTHRVVASTAAIASSDHPLVGSLLIDLAKFGPNLPADVLRSTRERSAPVMRGVGLDALTIASARGVIIAAPHDRSAEDEVDARLIARARRQDGKATFAFIPIFTGDTIDEVLMCEAARIAGGDDQWVAVAGAVAVGPGLIDPVRQAGVVDARIVDPKGRVIVAAAGDFDAMAGGPRLRLPLVGGDGEPVAWVEVAISDASLSASLSELSRRAVLLAALALAVTVALGFWVARRMTRDLDRLVTGANAAARGDLDHRVTVTSRDEISAVAHAFNAMMIDLKASKEKLVIAERLAAWQEVARRLAHEIKNPLTPIQMSVETMRRTFATQHPEFGEIFEESTATILEETARLKRIVGDFSELARIPKPKKQPCNVDDIVAGAVALYRGSIAVKARLAGDLPVAHVDRDQIAQVIINLLENARDAVATSELQEIIVTTDLAAPDRIAITVSDSGPGISPDARGHLFAPYFTTKGGRGTGLGLAIAHRIASDHGGTITAGDSAMGGASFTVELPLR